MSELDWDPNHLRQRLDEAEARIRELTEERDALRDTQGLLCESVAVGPEVVEALRRAWRTPRRWRVEAVGASKPVLHYHPHEGAVPWTWGEVDAAIAPAWRIAGPDDFDGLLQIHLRAVAPRASLDLLRPGPVANVPGPCLEAVDLRPHLILITHEEEVFLQRVDWHARVRTWVALAEAWILSPTLDPKWLALALARVVARRRDGWARLEGWARRESNRHGVLLALATARASRIDAGPVGRVVGLAEGVLREAAESIDAACIPFDCWTTWSRLARGLARILDELEERTT